MILIETYHFIQVQQAVYLYLLTLKKKAILLDFVTTRSSFHLRSCRGLDLEERLVEGTQLSLEIEVNSLRLELIEIAPSFHVSDHGC